MALTAQTLPTPWGFSVSNAYCVVDSVTILPNGQMSFTFSWFSDATGAHPSFQSGAYTTAYNPSAGDVFSQAYAYLKSLPEFAGIAISG